MISMAVISAGAPDGYRIGSPVTVLPVDRTTRTSGWTKAGRVVGGTVSAVLAFNDRLVPSSTMVPSNDRHLGSVQAFGIVAPGGTALLQRRVRLNDFTRESER